MPRVRPSSESDGAVAAPVLTVIVPTRDESDNVGELVRRLAAAVQDVAAEVLFVDDSDDDTPEKIREIGRQAPLRVRLVARPAGHRDGGLGGAVVAGLRAASSRYVVVMDGDLQHPPEEVPKLLRLAEQHSLDVVVASRRIAGGDTGGLDGAGRVAASGLATLLTKAVFPRCLRGVTDPMSGFFLVRREAIDLDVLQPHGFKILLEILARHPGLRRAEVPFVFAERHAGESKASAAEGMRFVRHLFRLQAARLEKIVRAPRLRRVAVFAAVGVSGMFVNTFLLWLLADGPTLHLPYLVAAALATQGSSIWNFLGVDRFVFSRPDGTSAFGRGLRFVLINNAALLLRLPALALLVEVVGIGYLVANVLTLVASFAARFITSERTIYQGGE